MEHFISQPTKPDPSSSSSSAPKQDDMQHNSTNLVTDDIADIFDASKEIREISIILGGKGGGGRKDLAQGGGSDVSQINESIKYVEDKLNSIS